MGNYQYLTMDQMRLMQYDQLRGQYKALKESLTRVRGDNLISSDSIPVDIALLRKYIFDDQKKLRFIERLNILGIGIK